MAITILHMRNDLAREQRLRISLPMDDEAERARLALEIKENGGYEAVAEIDTDDLEEAYTLTQNGVVSDSWSREPPEKLRPLGQAYVQAGDRKLGRKSSEVGDVFLRDGEAFVVASFGFEKIDGWEPKLATPSP